MFIFGDMLESDIHNVFFNAGELAEVFFVKGFGEIPIVQDDNRILEKADISALGTELGEGLIFVKTNDMPTPSPNEELSITGKDGRERKWFIRDVKENTGVYEIRLHRERRGGSARGFGI